MNRDTLYNQLSLAYETESWNMIALIMSEISGKSNTESKSDPVNFEKLVKLIDSRLCSASGYSDNQQRGDYLNLTLEQVRESLSQPSNTESEKIEEALRGIKEINLEINRCGTYSNGTYSDMYYVHGAGLTKIKSILEGSNND